MIGDFHIPKRSVDIPETFKDLLIPNKVQNVICTGNVGCKETMDWIRSLSANCNIVKGEYDENTSLQENKVFKIGNYKIGLVHGH